MGIKKATSLFSQECTCETTLAGLHKMITDDIGADSNYRIPVAIDGNVWVIAALKCRSPDSRVSAQFHAEPQVRVTAVSDYFDKRCNMLERAKFLPIIVFDGQRNPLKEEESDARQRIDLDHEYTALHEMYLLPGEYSLDEVLMRRKITIYPREDIFEEVIRAMREKGRRVVGSPFESDSQIRALYSQCIIDAAITTDTDYIGQGIPYTFTFAEGSGRVIVRVLSKLLKEVLPEKLSQQNRGRVRDINVDDLYFFCNMLGTDYLRHGLPGSGEQDCLRRFVEYLNCSDDIERELYVANYANQHPTQDKFNKSFFFWKNAPAFLVIPNDDNVSPRNAFLSNEYTIQLGNMSGVGCALDDELLEERLGFLPHTELRHNHPTTGTDNAPASLLDFFEIKYWSRTGKALDQIAKQRNSQGEVVVDGALLSFDFVTVPHHPDRCLHTYLSARGVGIDSIEDRSHLEAMVLEIHGYNIDALPKYVMCGGGGYVTNRIFKPNEGESIMWKRGGDAVDAIRSDELEGYELPETINAFFNDQFNSKRKRVLSHLKSGSIPIEDVQVTTELVTDLLPGKQIFVIQCLCSPSQKGIGTDKKLYCVRLAFARNDLGEVELLKAPFSLCDCPVGIGPCAHKGAGVLMIYVTRECLDDMEYDEVEKHMPANINTVAMQCQLVHHLYPAPYSSEYLIQRDIKKAVKEKTKNNEPELDGIELEQRNAEERVAAQHTNSEETNASSSPPLIDMCQNVQEWCECLRLSVEELGGTHLSDPKLSQQACKEAAKLDKDPSYLRRFNIRARRYVAAVAADRAKYDANDAYGCLPPTLYGCWAEHYVDHALAPGEGEEEIADHMDYPDIYSPGVDYEIEESDEEESDEEADSVCS